MSEEEKEKARHQRVAAEHLREAARDHEYAANAMELQDEELAHEHSEKAK